MAKYLITSALPYVNNVPHIGNIIGCVLSADVFARYMRSAGNEVMFISGTDEHGTTTEAKAQEEGVTPKQICDKYYAIHKKIYEWFGCSFDGFGRTSDKTHHDTTQEIFKLLDEKGYILKRTMQQLYCNSCKTFLSDRFLTGTCPFCGYDEARGDQCQKCSRILEAEQLINPKCKRCGSEPEMRDTEHLFLDLPKSEKKLHDWTHKKSKEGFWTENAITTTEGWFKEGLRERCITRDLSWGIHVPKPGFEHKVFYVWFDAPIGYISITKQFSKDWKKWWKNSDAKLYQFMAKDNIPFHTILFPASLMNADDGYNLLHHIDSTEFLTYEGGKFSKSSGTGVFGDDAMNSGINADVWRYYLLVNRPEQADTEFSWQDFKDKTNNELLANLGNFVNRTLAFVKANFESEIPDAQLNDNDKSFIVNIKSISKEALKLLEKVKLKESLRMIMHVSKLSNAYLQENEPWKTIKTDKPRAGTVMNVCCQMVYALSSLIEPFLPFTSEEILKQVNGAKMPLEKLRFDSLAKGHKIGIPMPLFRKLEDDEINKLREQHSAKNAKKEEPFAKVNLKAGRILEVRNHPNADKLYVLEVDLGTEKRTLCAGLAKTFKPEELTGKLCVVVANLQPAVLRGVESKGMLLAGDYEGKIKLVNPDKSSPGDDVYAEGINPVLGTITIDEFLKAPLRSRDGVVVYADRPLKTKHGFLIIDLPDNAVIR